LEESKLTGRLRAAIMNQRLYPTGSKSVEEVVLSVHKEIQTLLQTNGTLTLTRNNNRFFIDKTEVGAADLLIQVFEEHGIQGVIFKPGCLDSEVRTLVQGLSTKPTHVGSLPEWLSKQKVTNIHLTQTRVVEVSEDEAVVAKGLSQFHALESSEEMRAALKDSLIYIDTIPEKTMKENLRRHLAERLVLMEASLLKDLFDTDLGLGDSVGDVLQDVLLAMHQNKLMDLLNEAIRWALRLKTAVGAKGLEGEHAKLKNLVGRLSECPAGKKLPRSIFDELVQKGLLDNVPDYVTRDSSQDLRIEVDRLLAEKDAGFLMGGGKKLPTILEFVLAAGFQDRAKDIVQRTRAVLLEGESGLRVQAAQNARQFLPILWVHLRDDLVNRLRDAFLTATREERSVPVVREIIAALGDDLIHNYRARHTSTVLDEVQTMCALKGDRDSLPKEKPEFARENLKRVLEELLELLAEDYRSDDLQKRDVSRTVLSSIGDLGIPVFVRVILTTRDRALRSVAAETLKQYGPPGARALADQLNMRNSTFALFNIVSILGTLGGEEILEGLDRLVRYPDPDLRHAIVRILARLRGPKAADLALKFLKDEKESIRRLAADLLGDWKYEHAVHPLIGLLGAPSVEEAEIVCLALGQIGDPIAAEPLGRLLKEKPRLFLKEKNSRETVRIRAAWALAQLGPAGQAQLLPHREDDNPTVRDIAVKATS
jgi:HEAT repeat protein